MIGDREQQARFRSDFYRDSYHKLLNLLLFSCFLIIVLILAIIYFIVYHPAPTFYATTFGGQIIPMTQIVEKK